MAAETDQAPMELDADELTRLDSTFRAPRWLTNLGRTSWLLVGALLVLVGLVWLLGTTAQIVDPVTAALVVAAVASPIVARLEPHLRRTGAAVVVLLGFVAIAIVIAILVVDGITSQTGAIDAGSGKALDHVNSWLSDLGVKDSTIQTISSELKGAIPAIITTLTHGVFEGIKGLASLAFGLSLAALSLFFLLRDGPQMRNFVETHLGLPPRVMHTIVGHILSSLRNYFRGVTIVALFNGIVVGIGALLLDVPLPGTIAIVTVVTAYIPYIGAFVAGTLAVVLALGAQGASIALAMLVIVLLANGLLQNLFQPFVMGAALQLNPLVVLVVTIGAGCLFGTLGLILAAPLTSAAVQITRELGAARATTTAPA